MKKTLLLTTFMMLGVMLSAQTQQGYVKTKGRLAKDGTLIPGQRIPSASVILRGGNSTVSGDNGEFSLLLPENKFFLQNVQKKGYVLTDPEVLSKEYSYSKNDLILVMETPSDQWDDKRAAEKSMREQLQKRVDQQREELERLKEEQRVTDEEYRERLQRIFELYDENDKLVNEMAEEYAKIDYDQLDEYNRLIRQYILNGELHKADSLIHSKGDIDQRIIDLRKHQEANAKEHETLAKRQEQLEASQAGTQKLLEDIAQDCYNKFEICKLQHLNDSAAYWIELRAELDSTNVEWLNEAGLFVETYSANFNLALSYYQKALRRAIIQFGENSKWVGTEYNNIGEVYFGLGQYEKALESFNSTLEIIDLEDRNITTLYSNIGTIYCYLGDYEKALEFLHESLEKGKKNYGEEHIKLASTYNNIGGVLHAQSKPSEALIYFQKALALRQKAYGEENLSVADSYNSIGGMNYELGNTEDALVYFKKGMEIRKIILGENHPDIAMSYNNIGGLLLNQGNYTEAYTYLSKALEIFEISLGKDHPHTATVNRMMGRLYEAQNDYKTALEYFQKALNTYEIVLGKTHHVVAASYNDLGRAYFGQQNNKEALFNHQKAYEIFKTVFGENHPYTINTKEKIDIIQATIKEQKNEQTKE